MNPFRSCLYVFFLVFSTGTLGAQTEYKVYPGDTNNDGAVNVRDLLPIGIAFGSKVNAREDMATDWSAKPAIDSLERFLPNTLVNYVHINSNGDQQINDEDMEAIRMNYDSTLTEELPPPWAPEVFAPASYCPELRVTFDRDTAFLQDTFLAQIRLEIPATDGVPEEMGILGLAFAFEYPLDNINDKLTRIRPNTEGIGAELLFVTANAQSVDIFRNVRPGRGEVAAAGKGVNAMTKSLLIVETRIVVEDMIFRSPTDRAFWIDILPESVLIVNNREEQFEYCLPPSDTIILSDRISGLKRVDRSVPIRLWPNPSRGRFHLSSPQPVRSMQLYSMEGQRQWQQSVPAQTEIDIELPDLPAGAYLLVLETRETILRKQIVLTGPRG